MQKESFGPNFEKNQNKQTNKQTKQKTKQNKTKQNKKTTYPSKKKKKKKKKKQESDQKCMISTKNVIDMFLIITICKMRRNLASGHFFQSARGVQSWVADQNTYF